MKVCLGGTFNYLHEGHKCLIQKAIEVAGKNGSVFIGVTTKNLIKNKKGMKPFEYRKKDIEQYLFSEGYLGITTIKAIDDKYGPTLDEDFDAIIVSPETISTAEEINQKREKKEKKPLKIIQIPFVLAKDGKPISSTRIANKDIDEEGNVLNKD
jgi:pantetheine-phosphate adenylyltransferase